MADGKIKRKNDLDWRPMQYEDLTGGIQITDRDAFHYAFGATVELRLEDGSKQDGFVTKTGKVIFS
jgi:hypothetical protein